MIGDGMPAMGCRMVQGLEMTVWSTSPQGYSTVGYLSDQIEQLIDEWYPGKHKLCYPIG